MPGSEEQQLTCQHFSANDKRALRESHEVELFYRKYHHLGYCQALSVQVFLYSVTFFTSSLSLSLLLLKK